MKRILSVALVFFLISSLRVAYCFTMPTMPFLVTYNSFQIFQSPVTVHNAIWSIVIKDKSLIAFDGKNNALLVIHKELGEWKEYSSCDKYSNDAIVSMGENETFRFDLYSHRISSSVECDLCKPGFCGNNRYVLSFLVTTKEIAAAAIYHRVGAEEIKNLGLSAGDINHMMPAFLKKSIFNDTTVMVTRRNLFIWQKKLQPSVKNMAGLVLEGSSLPTNIFFSALTISDDGSIIAAGTINGQLFIWEKNENPFEWWGGYSFDRCYMRVDWESGNYVRNVY